MFSQEECPGCLAEAYERRHQELAAYFDSGGES
jgi:hypothetical protein